MIQALDFVGVPVENLDRAVAFYRDTLGLKCLGQAEHFAEFDLAGNTLSLNTPTAWGNAFTPLPMGTIALRVDDMDASVAALRAKGLELGNPFDTGVCKMAFFQDTEGNGLFLHHRYAPEH